MTIKSTQRYTPRPWSSKFWDALRDQDRVKSEMHLQAVMEWRQRFAWRTWSSEFGDALEGRDRLNSVMHLDAVIAWVWRCSWRPWWSELRDALRGCDLACCVSNGSSFGPGRIYRSAWQRPYPIKNRRFFKRTITLRPQILIREFGVRYVKYAAQHGASFGHLRFLISLNLSKW